MNSYPVMKAFDLADAPIDIEACFGSSHVPTAAGSFTSTVRVGFATRAVTGREGWWSREINLSEYELYCWLRDHGANDGETVLVCWAAAGLMGETG